MPKTATFWGATVLFPIVALRLEGYEWTITAVAGGLLAIRGNYVLIRRPGQKT